MIRVLLSLLAAAALAGVSWLGVRGAGPAPPLAPLLDPVNGAWAAARVKRPDRLEVNIPNLSAPVDVWYDRRDVPHIFAATEADAMRALGWAVARDRLFQLDAQTHAAAGRLTEWAGAIAMPADEEMRRLGLPASAEKQEASLAKDSRARVMIDAYADGVNAWIDGMRPADWPLEYRLLGVRPARWSPVNTMYLFARMGWTLAFNSAERAQVAVAALVGDPAASALFPPHSPIVEPIQPNGSKTPRFDFRPIPAPGVPDTAAKHIAALLPALPDDGEPRPSFASNNWAVSPRRTAAGKALLAGDPHLDMSLPSLWYEAHLVVPGTLDVYGVTIPGAPGIIIGFTRDVAWSFTNTGADVLDLYRETVDDPVDPRKYQVDGEWRPVELRTETYHGKRGEVYGIDTMRFTHRGPLSKDGDGPWVSMRWTVLQPELNQAVFLDAVRATTARGFLDIMAEGYGAPTQNMIVADRRGTIAIRSTGHYPIRPADARGYMIQDGSRSANDWQGYWPLDRYPQSFDPPQGFLASANQEPIDPGVRPDYIGLDTDFDPWRALHINRLLRADSAVTPETMRRWQTDPGSERAELFVPRFIDAARTAQRRGQATAALDSAASWLAAWDRRYVPDDESAVLFEAAMRQVPSRTWDELIVASGRRIATPSTAILLGLTRDSTSAWWDDHRTSEVVEDRDAILAASLVAAHDSLVRRYGARKDGGWRWGVVGATRVDHLLGLPAFSERNIAVQGGPSTLNPSSAGGHGPSWRMVVEMGDTVRAWGTYPGGQSGNPVSPAYKDRLPLWRNGELDTLFTPRDTASMVSTLRLRLVPAGARSR